VVNNNSLFDRNLLKNNLNRFSKNFAQSDFLFKEIANRLIENIKDFKQNFNNILEINAKDGYFGQSIYGIKKGDSLTQTNLTNSFGLENQIIIDDEDLELEEKFDLIINNLNLQFNNNIIKVLNQNKKLLKGGGLFVCSFFGGATLKELRDVFNKIELGLYDGMSPRVIPFIDIKDAGKLAQNAGFKNIICDSQIIEISYSSLLKLFQDLRNMAFSNILFARNKRFISKKMLFLMENLIRELYSDADNGFIVSFEIITITSLND
jgi:SAM-dependent methyltransferase